MLQYAWYASKLLDHREVFVNVNQVCFPTGILKAKNKCSCGKAVFIRCARCQLTYCFPCFYDEYHSKTCTPSLTTSNKSTLFIILYCNQYTLSIISIICICNLYITVVL